MKDDHKLHEKIGELVGEVKGVNKRLDRMNGTLNDTCKKVQKHEIVLGKAGLVFASIVVAVTAFINVIVGWIKDKL